MPVDRQLHSRAVTKAAAPPWICPTCAAAMLRLDPDTLSVALNGQSARMAGEVWFDAEHVEYRFSALLKCENNNCREVAVLAGRGEVEQTPDERMEKMEYEDMFFPLYFKPSPTLIVIPGGCPASVREELCAAFVASWGEFASAANRIRVAVERLLDALRIPKSARSKTGKRRALTLHDRIHLLPAHRSEVRDYLLAIKWLGNHGSHQTTFTRDAVFDALDIFESVLTALYSEHPRRIERLVAAVNKRKGLPRPRK